MRDISVSVDAGFDAFLAFIEDRFGASSSGGRIVRDVFGRLSFIAPNAISDADVTAANQALPAEMQLRVTPAHGHALRHQRRAACLPS